MLVINRNMQAVHITSARRALVLMWTEVARAVDASWQTHDFGSWSALPIRDGDLPLGTSRGTIRVPRVIQLTTYDRMPRATVRLTRRNVFLRDGHTCQYCARRGTARELNLDHVMPRSRGGPMTWENVVCSCRVCNLRKGGRTPVEASMHLIRKPVRPRWSPVLTQAFSPTRPREWDPFLASLPGARELARLWEEPLATDVAWSA